MDYINAGSFYQASRFFPASSSVLLGGKFLSSTHSQGTAV